MLSAYDKGKEGLIQYATQRLQSHSPTSHDDTAQANAADSQTGFYAKWPKLTLCNFASMTKPKKRTMKGHTFTLRYTRNLFHKMTVIALDRGLNIDEFLEYPLGPLPYSLATETGGLTKTSKSVLMHDLEKLVDAEETPNPTSHQVIVLDAMALIQTLKLSNNATFGDLAETMLKIIMRHVSSSCSTSVHWVCDTYPAISIKNFERESRMESAEGSFATTISSSEQKVDKQLKKALTYGKFKESLTQFLIDEWKQQKYTKLVGRHTVFATSGSKCYAFHAEQDVMEYQEIPELTYEMEEADQRLILHAHYASLQVPKPDVIVIRSPDTDVMVLATAACGLGWISSKCLFLTGTGVKTRYINVTGIGAKLGVSLRWPNRSTPIHRM